MEATDEVKKAAKRVLPEFSALGFMMSLIIAQLFYYINFQGEGFSREIALAYIIIPVALMAYYTMDHQIYKRPVTLDRFSLTRTIFHGLIGFMLTWVFMLWVYGYLLGVQFSSIPATAVWGTVLTQVLFVACSEELAFRYIIPAYLREKFPKAKYIPMLLAAASFAVFHSAAYDGNYRSMGLAFLVGLVWLFLYNVKLDGHKLGLGFTIGSHAAYNLTLVGVLSGGISLISGGI